MVSVLVGLVNIFWLVLLWSVLVFSLFVSDVRLMCSLGFMVCKVVRFVVRYWDNLNLLGICSCGFSIVM